MKREEAGGETAAMGSVPAPHLPATPLPAPQTQHNPNLLLFHAAKKPLFPGAGMLGGDGMGLAAGICRQDLLEGVVSRGQCGVFVCYS